MTKYIYWPKSLIEDPMVVEVDQDFNSGPDLVFIDRETGMRIFAEDLYEYIPVALTAMRCASIRLRDAANYADEVLKSCQNLADIIVCGKNKND